MPDIIVLVALLPRLLGARVVLYMFEATPEMYVDRFELKRGGWGEKLLRWQERVSVRSRTAPSSRGRTSARCAASAARTLENRGGDERA